MPVTAVPAVLVFALSLRLVFGSTSAVQEDLAADYGLGPVVLSLLTTAPVLCFWLVGASGGRIIARRGALPTAAGAMLLTAVGSVVRGVPGWQSVFLGTLVAGVGVAVGNVVGPVLIRILTPRHTGAMTGLYTALVGASAGIASGLTVPLRHVFGGVHPALAVWGIAPVVGLAVLLLVLRRRRAAAGTAVAGVPDAGAAAEAVTSSPTEGPGASAFALLRDPVVLALTAYMGLQSLVAYSMIAWLPSALRQQGMGAAQAGTALTVLSLVCIVTALLVPVLAVRVADQRVVAVALACLTLVGALGAAVGGTVWAMPSAVLLGLGQGGELALVMVLVNLRTTTVAQAAALSTVTQSGGYLLAALGPLAVGVVHGATGGWTAPMLVLVALSVVMAGAGLVAGRPGVIGATATLSGAVSPSAGRRA